MKYAYCKVFVYIFGLEIKNFRVPKVILIPIQKKSKILNIKNLKIKTKKIDPNSEFPKSDSNGIRISIPTNCTLNYNNIMLCYAMN